MKTMITTLGLATLLLIGHSCATPKKESANKTSSKFIYSIMIKDSVALESILSDDLKKDVKGDMVLKAFRAVEKKKGAMKGILFKGTKGNVATYEVKTKGESIPLKVQLDKLNKIEAVWIDDVALNKTK